MPEEAPGPTRSTPAHRRAWLWLVVGAALLSVVFAQAREQKPAGDEAKARGEFERVAAAPRRTPESINVLPFIRVAEKGRALAEAGRLDFDTALDLTATAELGEDGSFKPETATIEWREAGDEHLVELARQFVTAVSESRLPAVLRGYAKTARLTARLDRQNVSIGLEAEGASEAEATKWASGYGTLLLAARKAKEGTDVGRLYEAVKVASDGKVLRLTFEMPKAAAAKMVVDMLDRPAAQVVTPSQD